MIFSQKLLDEADALCKKCLEQPSDTMLCSGIRLYPREDYPGAPPTPGACEKLRYRRGKSIIEEKLKASGIPVKFIESFRYPKLKITQDFVFVEATDDLTEEFFYIGVDLITNFQTSFKYVLTHLLLKKYGNWDDLIVELGDNFDVLVIDRFDVGRREEYVSRAFAELFRYRYNNGLKTVVTYEAWKPRNGVEENLYIEMDNWSNEEGVR